MAWAAPGPQSTAARSGPRDRPVKLRCQALVFALVLTIHCRPKAAQRLGEDPLVSRQRATPCHVGEDVAAGHLPNEPQTALVDRSKARCEPLARRKPAEHAFEVGVLAGLGPPCVLLAFPLKMGPVL